VEVTPGKSIHITKNLTLAEEYLADHFPSFPVMPGVLMLQTLVEAASWLLRITEDFRYSVIVLREARNVKYGQFMEPGRQMVATAELVESDQSMASFKARGEVEGNQTVSARITLARYNLGDREESLRKIDRRLEEHWRNLYAMLAVSGHQDLASAS
jgi:3-hydroxyacyl-[acyl-carrier-protein] dehydratase